MGEGAESAEAARRAVPVLVLPLHGHLAPAAWARGAGRAGPAGRLRADRRRGAAGLALARRRRAARARPALRPHHRRPGLRRRARGAQHRRRPRRRRDGLGWDAVLVGPGPGIIGSDTELGHGGMAALDSAHAALSLGLPTLLSPRLSSSDPRERHRGLSHHTCTVLELLLGAGRGRRPRRGVRSDRDARPRPRLSATTCTRPQPTSTATRPRPADATMGRSLERTRSSSPPRSPRATLAGSCPHAPLRAQGLTAGWGEPAAMAIAIKPAAPPRPAARRRRPLRGPRPRLPLLPGAGARPLPQHAQRLPHRPAPVRRVPRRPRPRRAARRARPTSPTSSPSWPPARAARPARRRRSTARPPACAPSTSTCAATS